MIIFPYKVDSELSVVPIVTTLVTLICLITFFVQEYSWYIYKNDIHNFCQHEISDELDKMLSQEECIELFVQLDLTADPQPIFKQFIHEKHKTHLNSKEILHQLERMHKIVPNSATVDWWYEPGSYDIRSMLTSKVIHLNWMHLLFNLIFFLAFAVGAEQLLGHLTFAVFLLASAIATDMVYCFGALNMSSTSPSLGLSGVVTSTMIFVTLLYPHKFLHIFFWVLFFSGTFRLPLLLVSISYIGSDMLSITISKSGSNINYLSHIAGALTGILAAFTFLIVHSALKQTAKKKP
ncbi:rhomboid family intramembrane serine protease [Teredinibacter haidensis]|uniref:rhomboid family intramembrane serine protease n=1 Tax=Teredinibacter haidensis TaxID=2731755 RepID=UPI000948D9D9|nr:rhomboid family intramembrane serine protease [Teredinibacter haidensis]